MTYELQLLAYAPNSLEPYIDEQTMIIHHTKHHQSYVDKLNKALEKYPELMGKPLSELMKNIESVSEEIRTAVRNNAGGILNHDFFFSLLKKGVAQEGEIFTEIKNKFGSFANFQEQFSNSASTLFGSGWTWLVLKNNRLEILNTVGHENPISQGAIPLLVIDVWEHAYYLKYQNRRPEYIQAFFSIIDWKKVNELFLKYKQ